MSPTRKDKREHRRWFEVVLHGRVTEAEGMLQDDSELASDVLWQNESGPNGTGETPLHRSAFRVDPLMVRLLLLYGAVPAAQNAVGETALDALAEGSPISTLLAQDSDEEDDAQYEIRTLLTTAPVMCEVCGGIK